MKTNKRTARFLSVLLCLAMLISAMPALAETPVYYQTSYASKQDAINAGAQLNLAIASEGMVLLKNDNGALPLADAKNITVFGYASVKPAGGGNAEAGDTSGGVVKLQSNIYSSLADAGFVVNPVVKASYDEWLANEEVNNDNAIDALEDIADVKAAWAESYAEYDSAAVIVLSSGASAERVHSLQYDAAQYALIEYAAENFETVIVLINNSKPLEISALKQNKKVDAILVTGEPGDNGFDALGKILTGEVNPSGRLVDTWAADFTKTPSYANYNVTGDSYGYGNYEVNGEATDSYFVEYEEGIYVGYRYFETRGYEETKADAASTWYDDNVTYAFGYGLSYTDFAWEVVPAKAAGSEISKDDVLSYDVTVTNTGAASGKEVVQLYYTAPYGDETTNPTKIEKAYVVLGDFAKTKELAPGESETLTLSIKTNDLASYDYVSDKTYVLDDGEYGIKISRNAHDVVAEFGYTVAEKTLINVAVTGTEITNQLDDVTEGYLALTDKHLSRADFEGTLPTAAPETIELTEEEYIAWDFTKGDGDDPSDPWYVTEENLPTQADEATRPEKAAVVLTDLVGKDIDDPAWEAILDELSIQEMANLLNNGGFKSINLDYIGKPYSFDTDGPKGWTGTGRDTTHEFNQFAAEPVIASTFNKELVYQMGVMIGEQGLWGNSTAASGMAYNYTGWYAPGMNIHRSPFDGRGTEYYSEDPFLTGTLAASASLGAKSKGAYVSLKHFAFHNDGGGVGMSFNDAGQMVIGGYRGIMGYSNTAGLSAWFDEQAAREIYLKGYQIAVEEGEATFIMSSFTRVGPEWCGGSYAVNTSILRNEWGFKGAVVTDIGIYGFVNVNQLVRAGADFLLSSSPAVKITADTDNTATKITAMRNATKHVLYLVANSNAMQLPLGAKVVYAYPTVTNAEGDVEALAIEAGKVGEAFESPALNTASLNTYGAFSTIFYTAEGLAEGLSFDAATGIIGGTPVAAGTYIVTITAEAEGYGSASVDYEIVVE